jgi:phage-related holin
MKEDKSVLEILTFAFGGLLLKIKTEVSILLLTFFSFLSPIKGVFVAVGLAVFLDTAVGVYVARKNKEFNSNNLFNMVVKKFFYMSTILLAYLIDSYVINQSILGIPYFTAKITCVFWIYIEGKSIHENSQKLGNKPFAEIITNLIKWVKSIKKDINEIKH